MFSVVGRIELLILGPGQNIAQDVVAKTLRRLGQNERAAVKRHIDHVVTSLVHGIGDRHGRKRCAALARRIDDRVKGRQAKERADCIVNGDDIERAARGGQRSGH